MSSCYWYASRSYFAFWPKLKTTTEQLFGTGSASALGVTTTTRYSYLGHSAQSTIQPIRVARQGADGRQVIAKTRYAGQYDLANVTNSPGSPIGGLQQLVEHNLISTPIEHQSWLRTGADSSVVGGDLTFYKDFRPERVFALAVTTPISATQFTPTQVVSNTFVQDSHYRERVSFPLYSRQGSLLQQQVTLAPPTSYLWGHDETKLLAEAQQAPYNTIAYTSFEDDATGRWQYDSLNQARFTPTHLTGRRGYQLDNNSASFVRRPHLPAGEYEVLLWAHGSTPPQVSGGIARRHELVTIAPSGWRLHRFRLSLVADATVEISATQPVWIDELRLYPVGAQMSSYTYDPLVGMTSQTDPSGRTTTYEYDAVGRLVRTRDEQGRILAQQKYHYADR